WCTVRPWCWPTSPPATSTPAAAAPCWNCCASWPRRRAAPCCWPPTVSPWRASRPASSPWKTATCASVTAMNSPGSGRAPHLPAPLLRRQAARHARRHPWQTWLSFFGIMLGVMMVVAVDLANGSARRAFALSLEAVEGNISHRILGGPQGVPDELFTALRTEPGLRTSAPALSGRVRAGGLDFTLLGIDPVSEAALA